MKIVDLPASEICNILDELEEAETIRELEMMSEAESIIRDAIVEMDETCEYDEWHEYWPPVTEIVAVCARVQFRVTNSKEMLTVSAKVDGKPTFIFLTRWQDYGTYWDPPEYEFNLAVDAADAVLVQEFGTLDDEVKLYDWGGKSWYVAAYNDFATVFE